MAVGSMEETEMKMSRHLVAAFTSLATVVVVGGVSPKIAQAQEVRIVVAPPAPRVEIPGARPGPYHVWQAGSWAWHPDGSYGWQGGFGTSWANFPDLDLTVITLTQRAFDQDGPPPVLGAVLESARGR